jgi:hypothetical protein
VTRPAVPATVHVVAPSFRDARVALGGTCMYRSAVLTAADGGPVVCYSGGSDGPGGWRPDLPVLPCPTAAALLAELERRARPGDTIAKFAGAVGVEEDWRADIRIAALAARRRCRAVYLDGDAPFRLAFLRPRHHLGRALAGYAAVVLFAGGARAAAEYRRLSAPAPVQVLTVSAAQWGRCVVDELALGTGEPAAPLASGRDVDVLVPVAARSSREDGIRALVDRWTARQGLRVALVGDWPAELTGRRGVGVMSFADPTDLLPAYRRSRFTLNALRREFAGYSDTAAARLFEAALCGSVLITEHFPGVERVLCPGTECLAGSSLAALRTLVDTPEPVRQVMAERAYRRVLAEVAAASARLAEVLRAPAGQTSTADPDRLAALEDRYELGRPRRRRLAALPGVRPAYLARLRRELPAAVVLPVGGVDEAMAAAADGLVVPSTGKNRADEHVRARGWRPAEVFVDVLDAASAHAARWVPGRDRLLPRDDGWPWVTGS